MQLQKDYAKYKALDTDIVCVLREEKDGVEGAKKMAKKTGAEFPILLDLGKKETAAYSGEGFHTYLIDRMGVLRYDIAGVKAKRPTSAMILDELTALSKK